MSMTEPRIYQALALADEALDKGGVEILRAGLVDDELYVSALRAFDDPATWGEVLGDIARRLVEYVERLDAVDFSQNMIERGKQLPNGNNPHLHWIYGKVEESRLT